MVEAVAREQVRKFRTVVRVGLHHKIIKISIKKVNHKHSTIGPKVLSFDYHLPFLTVMNRIWPSSICCVDFLNLVMACLRTIGLVLVMAVVAVFGEDVSEGWDQSPKYNCQKITIPMCQGLGYNLTVMPNFMENTDQKQAEEQLLKYMPLVQPQQCSENIRYFLCSVFAPLCSEHVRGAIASCRSLCLTVRNDCLPRMAGLDLESSLFNCSRFPDSENQICMQNPNNTDTTAKQKPIDDDETWWPLRNSNGKHSDSQCPPNFVKARDSTTLHCIPKCGKDAFYRIEDKRFAASWFTGWAWLCFLSTLFTLLTFCVDSSRFRYPERPVIFLAMCNNVIAMAYIVRGSNGSKSLSCAEPSGGGDSYLAVDGLESASCTFLFLVLYYFSMSSSVWFVNLTISWYLSAAKKWSTEALENISSYFHVAAWTIPAVFAVAALVLHKVSADELTGICQVSDAAVIPFTVIPHTVLLFLGCLLACLGGAALIRVRRAVKLVGRSTSKLERLMSRLVAFGLLFIVPALGSLSCVLYESFNKPRWQSLSLSAAFECQYQSGCSQLPSTGVGVEIALLRLFLSLAVGITTGMWVWSGKTCRVWGSLFTKAPNKPKIGYRQAPTMLMIPNRTLIGRIIDNLSLSFCNIV
ncbi:frizzled-4-like [Arctopsyche grandis]|uniref:frizzled-4-like n=1 Tax=Arctopsyche grandis TaxID=121162 RepID=UPI00406D8132